MTEEKKEHIGVKLRDLRQEFNLNQEDWAKLLQVSTNTVARWERGEMELKGSNKKKAEQMIAISNDPKIMETIKSTLASDGGLPAVAALLGMLLGVLGFLGISLSLAAPLLKSKSSLLAGIKEYLADGKDKGAQEVKNAKGN